MFGFYFQIFESRVNLQHSNSVIISVIFTNKTEQQVKNLEFNVMDSLNTKLVRGPGNSQHDSIRVPFVLLPHSQNEAQFAFTLDSICMPQKLRGTVTYMTKVQLVYPA